ncbi:MAG TPA: hypothetical protein VD978_25610 [Azospirillum sp.]|nr:hypothetical protein [Azospirillum sp.]
MTQPVPLDEATQLYNEVADLASEDSAGAARLAFRLRRYVLKQPNSFAARVALGHSLLLCGERAQAVRELQTAWDLLDVRDLLITASFGRELASVADFERARILLDRFRSMLESTCPFAAADLLAQLGFFTGDTALIEQGAAIEQRAGRAGTALEFQSYLAASGVGPYLAAHQEAVFSIIRPHQLWTSVQFHQDDDSDVPTAWVRHHVDLDWPEIRKLRKAMWAALDEHYQRSGISGALIAPFLSHDIVPVDRMPVFQVA